MANNNKKCLTTEESIFNVKNMVNKLYPMNILKVSNNTNTYIDIPSLGTEDDFGVFYLVIKNTSGNKDIALIPDGMGQAQANILTKKYNLIFVYCDGGSYGTTYNEIIYSWG